MTYKYNLAPKSLDEQCAAFKKQHPTLEDLQRDEYIMMPKYDGCLAILVSETQAMRTVLSRTGEVYSSIPHTSEQAAAIMPGHVVFGEVYQFGTKFKDISGAFRRHAPQPHLIVVAFDAVPVADWLAGKCDIPYIERLRALKDAWQPSLCPSIIVAPWADLAGPQAFANALVAHGGYDGAIIRRKDAPWTTGASKNGEAIKVKPVQSLDLKVTGWYIGKGKHADRAGGITVTYRGVSTDVGTGFSDAERESIYETLDGRLECHTLAGKPPVIAEIEFMELTADGKLREPRFKGWRYDKDKPDQ